MRGFKLNYNNSKTWQNKLGVKESSCIAQHKLCANHMPYAFENRIFLARYKFLDPKLYQYTYNKYNL